MKIERKYGRLVLKLFLATVVFAVLPFLMNNVLDLDSWLWTIIGFVGALGCMMAGMIIRTKHLRCPNCKRGIAVPQWNPGRRYLCTVCRRPFVYDDEKG